MLLRCYSERATTHFARLSVQYCIYSNRVNCCHGILDYVNFHLVTLHVHPLCCCTRGQYRDQPYSQNLSRSCSDDCHRASRHELCHRSRVWTRRPGCSAFWCVFLSFLSLPYRPEVLMDHDEGMGGSESALQVREAQPVVSPAETEDETSSPACCCIPSGVFRPFVSMRGGINIDHSQRNVSHQSIQTGQGLSLREAPIRAYFLAIAETSLA